MQVHSETQPRSQLALLVGKEVLVECIDSYLRHNKWHFNFNDTQRFVEVARDPSLRLRLQPELVREVDSVLERVIVPMGF